MLQWQQKQGLNGLLHVYQAQMDSMLQAQTLDFLAIIISMETINLMLMVPIKQRA